MARLHILILSALPICLAQFSIQGPSDGNRAAQSLRYSEEKGIEYSDQRDSLGAGDFSIQGATDGNSDFKIQGPSVQNSDFQTQGATDGHSDFRIQGATDGGADFKIQGATDGNANFQIQGATDGNYQSPIQNSYDANQAGQRSLQYDNPNGFRINWRSYAHGHLSPQPQQQPRPEPAYNPRQDEPQYAPEPAPRPAPRPAPQPTYQNEPKEPPQQPISYRAYDNAPAQIKQLLQYQAQIPYLNAIPEHLRYESLAAAQPQPQPQSQSQPQAQYDQAPQDAPQRGPVRPSQYRSKPRGHQRSKRQAREHQGQQQQQQQPQQQYRRIPQPAPEKLPQYSTNVPSQIKQLIQFQQQIPYTNVIPEQFRYNLDTPPTPVQPYRSSNVPHNAPRASHQRSKRQTHQRQYQNQQRQQPQQQQYKRIPQPAPEVQPQYSNNVPSQIKQLLQFQSQIPYVNAIPEQFRYNLENVPAQAQPYPSQHSPQNTAGGNHQRGKRQAQKHQQQQQPRQQYRRIPQPALAAQPQYSTNVPPKIKQLLQFQSQIPYVNAIPEQFRYNLEKVQHAAQNSAQSGHQRGKRQAQQHQGQPRQQYSRIPQPAPEVLPQYSNNLPSDIRQILKFQAQTPYNIIANQITYRLEQPYVPQPVSSPVPNYPVGSGYQDRGYADVRPVTEPK